MNEKTKVIYVTVCCGKSFCSKCLLQVKHCPMCRALLPPQLSWVRNRTLEAYVEVKYKNDLTIPPLTLPPLSGGGYKIIVIGASASGKTNILTRFTDNVYSDRTVATIGVNYINKVILLKVGESNRFATAEGGGARGAASSGDMSIKLQLFDTAGQERFRSMTSAFYKKADSAIVVFSVIDRSTFDQMPNWLRDVKENAPEGCVVVFTANMCDRPESEWKVSRKEFVDYANSCKVRLYETSGKTNQNLELMFQETTKQILKAKGWQTLSSLQLPKPAGGIVDFEESNLSSFSSRDNASSVLKCCVIS